MWAARWVSGERPPPWNQPTPDLLHVRTVRRKSAGVRRRLKLLILVLFSLDDPTLRELAVSDPNLFLERFPPPLLIDEIQYATGLLPYLQRDVRDLTQVGSIETFTRFVRACAARTAQLLNLSDLARDVDVSVPTAKSWLSVLVASCQVFLLQPYHTNVTKRLVKTPKLYFLDTGLCA